MPISRTLPLPALSLVVLSMPVLLAQEDWPQFRGSRGDGCARSATPPRHWSESKNVAWKTAVHGRGWSSPVVWERQIWVTTATEDGKEMFAVAIDRDTGQILHDRRLWEVAAPRPIHDLNSYASPTPAIESGRVYVHFGSYGTAALDTRTAEELWRRRDLPCDHFRGPGSSPIIFGDLLIVHFDGFDYQYVVALDKRTGNTVWRTERSNDFRTDDGDFKKAFCTPIVIEVDGRPQLVSPGSRAAMGYDPTTGEEIWQVRFQSFSSTAMPMFGNSLIYINTGFSKADLVAVRPGGRGDVTDTHVAWTARRGVPSKPSSLLVGKHIFMIHDAGVASCLDALTGETVWSHRIGGKYSASPLAAGGAVYFFSEDGRTTIVAAEPEYEELAVNALDDGFMASPAVAGSALYLRTKTHLYRIEK